MGIIQAEKNDPCQGTENYNLTAKKEGTQRRISAILFLFPVPMMQTAQK